jgi:hypothetical protein
MTQIDLSWASSTDDFILSGYQVFRDDIQIATTTATTYSDVGLTPSTTYTYYLTAFDSFDNFSASSTLVSTTTFATPTPPVVPPVEEEDTGPTFGSIVRLGELVSLEVIPSQYGAVIRFETSGYVRSVVKWGTTISYELGSSAERAFSKFHEITIGDLRPGTRYRFSIEGENHIGRTGTLTESSFVTLPENDVTPPGNVLALTATSDDDDVVLSWINPRDTDFNRVRVLRSELFFPGNEDEGWVVYEGGATEARDIGIAVPGKKIFYTVFTYDEIGNVSSGAVVSVRIGTNQEGIPEPVIDETKNEILLDMRSVDFYQDDVKLTPNRGAVTIQGGQHLTIAIPYDTLPEHLKTILVSIIPATDREKELNFLLRVNKEKTAYTARLAPLGVSGKFTIRISVFDYKTAQIGYAQGVLTSVIHTYTETDNRGGAGGKKEFIWSSTFMQVSYLVLFIFCLIMLAYGARRLMHRNNGRS